MARGFVHDHQGVDAGIDFRVIVRPLRHTEQRTCLRQESCQGTAFAQDLEHARRPGFHQAFCQFLPDPLGDQMIDFAAGNHGAHQRQRFRRDREFSEARRETGEAQDAYGIFCESWADMAQNFGPQIALTAEGVHQGTVR